MNGLLAAYLGNPGSNLSLPQSKRNLFARELRLFHTKSSAPFSVNLARKFSLSMEEFSGTGSPANFLFAIMIGAWGFALAKPLMQKGALDISDYAWQTGHFAAFFAQEWPLTSSSEFLNMPLVGIAFLILGMGLWRSVNPTSINTHWAR